MEILQLALQKPELAILDETDSGLDIDALRVVANGVNAVAGPDMGVLIITHYQRILHLVQPSHVHVMYQGRIVREGGPELVDALEAKGYGVDHRRDRGGRLMTAVSGRAGAVAVEGSPSSSRRCGTGSSTAGRSRTSTRPRPRRRRIR